MEHVPAERLTLNPDCGFSPSSLNPTEHRRGLSEAEGDWAKPVMQYYGARMLRERHG